MGLWGYFLLLTILHNTMNMLYQICIYAYVLQMNPGSWVICISSSLVDATNSFPNYCTNLFAAAVSGCQSFHIIVTIIINFPFQPFCWVCQEICNFVFLSWAPLCLLVTISQTAAKQSTLFPSSCHCLMDVLEFFMYSESNTTAGMRTHLPRDGSHIQSLNSILRWIELLLMRNIYLLTIFWNWMNLSGKVQFGWFLFISYKIQMQRTIVGFKKSYL